MLKAITETRARWIAVLSGVACACGVAMASEVHQLRGDVRGISGDLRLLRGLEDLERDVRIIGAKHRQFLGAQKPTVNEREESPDLSPRPTRPESSDPQAEREEPDNLPLFWPFPTSTAGMAMPPPGVEGDAGGEQCCKVCTKGKACGDSCIGRQLACSDPPGCACDARVVE